MLIAIASSAMAADFDWPGWLGPNRDGKSLDSGLLRQWPAEGPKLLWKVDGIGVGFPSVAVTAGKVYITGDRDGKLTISAFDLDGKPLWNTDHGRSRGGPDGSRSTAVIDDGNLYLMNGHGLIGCYDAADGMLYLFSESRGRAGLATCSPEGLQLKGQLEVEGDGPSWAHPVVVDGRLYLHSTPTCIVLG